jgi:hypothetical protein
LFKRTAWAGPVRKSKFGVLWRKPTSGEVALRLMNGTSVVSAAGIGSVPNSWTIAQTGDFNFDAKSDILWRNTSGDIAMWLMNGTTQQQPPSSPTCLRHGRGGGACPLVRKLCCQGSHRDACSQSLEVDREVDARQGNVEIIDVEKNVFLRGGEGSEVHQMAVAARLDRNSRGRLMPQVLRHHRGRAAQEGEWAGKHSLIANRYQLRHAGAVASRQERYRVAVERPEQIRVFLTGGLSPQANAPIVAFGKCAGRFTKR